MSFDSNQAIPVRRIGGGIFSNEHGITEKEGNVTTNYTQLLSLLGTGVTGNHGELKGTYHEISSHKGLFLSNNWLKPMDLDK